EQAGEGEGGGEGVYLGRQVEEGEGAEGGAEDDRGGGGDPGGGGPGGGGGVDPPPAAGGEAAPEAGQQDQAQRRVARHVHRRHRGQQQQRLDPRLRQRDVVADQGGEGRAGDGRGVLRGHGVRAGARHTCSRFARCAKSQICTLARSALGACRSGYRLRLTGRALL